MNAKQTGGTLLVVASHFQSIKDGRLLGFGLQLDPKAVQYLPDTLRILMTSGLLPAALLAIVLNLILPEELSDEATEEVSGGMAGHGD